MTALKDAPPPQHAFELRVHVGGEDWEMTLRELERLVDHVRGHGPACNISSGGGGTSSQVSVGKRDVSPEQYRDELEAWMLQRRRDRKRRGGPVKPPEFEEDESA